MTPEELQPLIDALGDINLLEHIMFINGREGEAIEHRSRHSAKSGTQHGVHYSGAHWYARLPSGTGTDSYTLNYQSKGTAHFCQTFAVMIYTGKDSNLVAYDYAGNIVKAMDFLLAYLKAIKKDKALKAWLSESLSEVDLTITEFERKIIQAKGSAAVVSNYN